MATRLLSVLFLSLTLLWASNSFALSDYGRSCDDNPKCRKCRDEDVKCQLCLNACWNAYGPAETHETKKLDNNNYRDELCRIKRAKWCAAQCWDPDDLTNPDYVTTKPKCGDSAYPKYESRYERPW